MPGTSGLSERRRRFAEEYPKDVNATQAAIRAGFSVPGARVRGVECLRDPRVLALIEPELAARQQRCEIESDAVLRDLALLVFADPSHYEVGEDGQVRLAPGAPPGAMRALAHAQVGHWIDPDGVVHYYIARFRFHDKVAAIDKAMKHLGILNKRIAHGACIEVDAVAVRQRIGDRLRKLAEAPT